MHILIDITHPAHVHFFRNAIEEWKARGHRLTLVSRDKDLTLPLLDEYGYRHRCLSKARKGVFGLGIELLEHEGRLYFQCRKDPPDIFLEIGGAFVVHAAKLLRRPSVIFYDTENATVSNAVSYPFATAVCTPSCYRGDIRGRHVRYEGYHELAYLHPNRFTPDASAPNSIGLNPDDPYFVVRFVNWQAGHDIGKKGFSLKAKRELIRRMEKYGRVIITSESRLPEDLEPYRMRLSPAKIHHLLAFAGLYVGEGATMAAESAVLGTPAVYVNPSRLGYTDELERRFGLCLISDMRKGDTIEKVVELLNRKDLKRQWRERRRRMLKEKIDVTAWMVKFIEGFG